MSCLCKNDITHTLKVSFTPRYASSRLRDSYRKSMFSLLVVEGQGFWNDVVKLIALQNHLSLFSHCLRNRVHFLNHSTSSFMWLSSGVVQASTCFKCILQGSPLSPIAVSPLALCYTKVGLSSFPLTITMQEGCFSIMSCPVITSALSIFLITLSFFL